MLMETVIVMPLLVALIFGALQMAHIHVARQIVSYAAYAAARSTLSVAEDREKEEAQDAAQRILCWLVASPDSFHDGVMMPDPEAKSVGDRLLAFKVTKNAFLRRKEMHYLID